VSELLESEAVFYALQRTLASFPDVEHVLAACVQVPRQELASLTDSRLSAVLSLKLTVQLVKQLATALADSRCTLLQTFLTVNCVVFQILIRSEGSCNVGFWYSSSLLCQVSFLATTNQNSGAYRRIPIKFSCGLLLVLV
jgi:hypothetical protein